MPSGRKLNQCESQSGLQNGDQHNHRWENQYCFMIYIVHGSKEKNFFLSILSAVHEISQTLKF